MQFSLKLEEAKVSLDGRPYTMRELDGAGREAFADLQIAATDDEGNVKSVRGLSCGLVAMSLFDEGGAPVSRETVDRWPGRVVEALALRARGLSGLGKSAEGNAQGASGEDGSGSP